ncbi:MAG TPA: polyketide cyclase, partial [Acidobacteriota bacterium]|nr:polyketide cyclase [Acidobacteriota bacterium]
MLSNEYHFITQWCVDGTVQEVSDVIGDVTGLVRWWPSVYLDVMVVEPGNSEGVGKLVELYTKGWLPYTLRWRFRVTESRKPYGFSLEAI